LNVLFIIHVIKNKYTDEYKVHINKGTRIFDCTPSDLAFKSEAPRAEEDLEMSKVKVLPILTELGKTFQPSARNFGQVKPTLDYTQTQLTSLKRLGRVGIILSDQDKRFILTLNGENITVLKQNIVLMTV